MPNPPPEAYRYPNIPPTEVGHYWLEWTPHNLIAAKCQVEYWWLPGIERKVPTQELVDSEWYRFGPKIELPAPPDKEPVDGQGQDPLGASPRTESVRLPSDGGEQAS